MLTAPVLAQVVTQVIGFLLFVWVLRRYAWGPILSKLEERRETIREKYDAVQRQLEKAQRTEQEYQAKLRDIEQERRRKINEGHAEGQRIREELVRAGRQDAQNLRDRQQQQIELEKDKARVQIRNEVIDMVLTATEKLIHERLDDARHRRLIEQFVEEIQARGKSGGQTRA